MAVSAIVNGTEFGKKLSAGMSGGFLLFGPEDYLKAHCLRQAEKKLCTNPDFAVFDYMKINATDYTDCNFADALENALIPLPIGNPTKLIVITGADFNQMNQAVINDITDTLSTLKEYDHNTVFISVPAGCITEGFLPKKPSPLITKLSELVTPVWFDKASPAKVAAWSARHFAESGVSASESACTLLVELCGTDLFTLDEEIKKISYYTLAHGKTTVGEDEIFTCASTTLENDAFALANALIAGDGAAALRALAALKFGKADPVAVLAEISGVFCDMLAIKRMSAMGTNPSDAATALKKMNEYRYKRYLSAVSRADERDLRRALELCVSADEALKRSPQGFGIIEKLICSITA